MLDRRLFILSTSLLSLALSVPARSVQADQTEEARAEELFRLGKEQLAQADYDRACASLHDSVALDRATGSLLALALCHERQGKLASALHEYEEAAVRSHDEGRGDRERAALHAAEALRHEASTLTITSVPAIAELRVVLAGAQRTKDDIGAPIPVDGGTVRIEAAAPGRVDWSTTLEVAPSGDALTVVVPELQLVLPAAERAAEPREVVHVKAEQVARDAGLNAAQWTALGLLGAGACGVVASIILVVRAESKNDASEPGCHGDLCTVDARRDRLYARDAGNAATVTFLATAGLTVTGLVLYWAAGQHASTAADTDHGSLRFGWSGTGAFVRGKF